MNDITTAGVYGALQEEVNSTFLITSICLNYLNAALWSFYNTRISTFDGPKTYIFMKYIRF